MNRLAKRYNAIVIGVGGAGSAAVYELAKRGKRVLGLERYDIPHDMGSSHGYTRIIRLAYYEHPSYVMLLRRAYELWREIETHVGEQLLHITGSIDAGPADSWVFKGSWQSCLDHNLPHEVLTGDYESWIQSWAPSDLSPGQALQKPRPLFKKLDPDVVVPDELARMEARAAASE